MESHANFEFVARDGTPTPIAALKAFLQDSRDWCLAEKESAEYAHAIDRDAVIAISADHGEYPRVMAAIAAIKDDGQRMRLMNIVPENGEIAVGVYNQIARDFVQRFRAFARHKAPAVSARIRIERTPATLEQIISGSVTRKLFEQFLFPGAILGTAPIVHPNDIERLDAFICALHRWKSFCHAPALERWLVVEKHWPEKDAAWLCARIETGLEILRANARFR